MGTQKFNNLQRKSYLQIRDQIQTGDIFFASGNYAFSKMIQHFSDSKFSHVGFVFTWNTRVLLLESVEDDGVRLVPLSQYLSNYENSGQPYNGQLFLGRYNAPLDTSKVNLMLGKAADSLHKKYDQDEIINILARVTIGLGKHGDNDAYICSEFVDICFKEIGIIFPRDPNGFIFPEHIASDNNVNPLFEIVA